MRYSQIGIEQFFFAHTSGVILLYKGLKTGIILNALYVHIVNQVLTLQIFSGGELAYMSIILVLYLLLLTISVYKFVMGLRRMLEKGRTPFHRLFVIIGIITVFCICMQRPFISLTLTVRVVLFGILLSQQIVDISAGGIYVLIEFPILLYFLFVSNFLFMWYETKNSRFVLHTLGPSFKK